MARACLRRPSLGRKVWCFYSEVPIPSQKHPNVICTPACTCTLPFLPVTAAPPLLPLPLCTISGMILTECPNQQDLLPPQVRCSLYGWLSLRYAIGGGGDSGSAAAGTAAFCTISGGSGVRRRTISTRPSPRRLQLCRSVIRPLPPVPCIVTPPAAASRRHPRERGGMRECYLSIENRYILDLTL